MTWQPRKRWAVRTRLAAATTAPSHRAVQGRWRTAWRAPRLTTQTIAALADRGYPVAQIAAMYDEPEVVIGEAVDLERQLAAA
jgi:hypothetical protein